MKAIHSDNGVTSGKKLSLVYISMGNYDASSFAEACHGLGWMDISITAVCDNSESMSQDSERFSDILNSIGRADLSIVKAHGDRSYFPNFKILFDRISASGSKLFFFSSSRFETDDFRPSFPFSDEDYRLLSTLVKIGGVRNFTTVLLWACRRIAGMDIRVPDPAIPTSQGIYPLGCGSVSEENRFLAAIDNEKPVVGLLISHMVWRKQETVCVDELISALRSRGAEVIPIFFKSIEDPDTRSIGVSGCIRKYFMKGRKSRVDVIVTCRGFSQTLMSSESAVDNPFRITGVPVIQCPTLYTTADEWESDPFGMSAEELSASIKQTEYDGQIASVPLQFVSGRGKSRICSFVRDRVDRIADFAMAWCRLRRAPRSEIKTAIILNSSTLGSIGIARGLSTLDSLRTMLSAMERNGYRLNHIPRNQNEMLRMLGPIFGQDPRWAEEKGCASAGTISGEDLVRWLGEVHDLARCRIAHGIDIDPSYSDEPVPGIIDGNVFIGVEPGPGSDRDGRYMLRLLGFYRWIEDIFHADALVHLGDHGITEWLPGKMACLSSDCIPDILLHSVPVIYPFAVDDPGNAVIAKRRAHAVIISHLVPPEKETGSLHDMEELEVLLQSVMASSLYNEVRDDAALYRIMDLIGRMDLWTELSLTPDIALSELEKAVPSIVDYISVLKHESVPIGLHTFGSSLKGQKLIQSVTSSLRFRNGDAPSLPEILRRASPDADDADDHAHCLSTVSTMSSLGFEPERCINALGWNDIDGADRLMEFVYGDLVPGFKACNKEMTSLLKALNGCFINPGPAGFPYGGGAHILPTGRNIYAEDVRRLPSRTGWIVGCHIADETVARYRRDHGKDPDSVAVIVNGGNILANGGTGLASALRLLGLRPVWSSTGGTVIDLEEVPPEEQGRPRIDVRICMVQNIANLCEGVIRLIEEKLGIHHEMLHQESGNGIRETRDWSSSSSADVDVIIANRGICNIVSRGADGSSPSEILEVPRKRGPPDLLLADDRGTIRSVYEDIALIVRTRLSNPVWIEGLREHGADGTSQLVKTLEHVEALSRTEGSTEPWMFSRIVETLVSNDLNSRWIMRSNPAAMCEIVQFLSRSSENGLWRMDGSTDMLLKETFLTAEELMEDQNPEDRGDHDD